MCVLMFKSSHRPDGKIADELALILAFTTANDASVKQEVRAEETSKVPIAPMGKLLTRLPQLSLAQLRLTL